MRYATLGVWTCIEISCIPAILYVVGAFCIQKVVKLDQVGDIRVQTPVLVQDKGTGRIGLGKVGVVLGIIVSPQRMLESCCVIHTSWTSVVKVTVLRWPFSLVTSHSQYSS